MTAEGTYAVSEEDSVLKSSKLPFLSEGKYRLPPLPARKKGFLFGYSWYNKDSSPTEKKLLIKLDLLVCFYSLVCYWIKMIDTSNLNNAYVSGMSEDLGLGGNDLVHLTTMYFLGCVIFQLPCIYLFPKVRMDWVLPTMDVGWSFFTLAQYRATGYHSLLAYRFFVGVFEAGAFPAIQYVLGSWFRADELARRGSIFYFGYYLGTMTAGLLQASIYNSLDGVNGLAGWRWMFIINFVISLPVGLLGYIIWPGTPDRCHSYFLTDEEVALARSRLKENGNKNPTGFSKTTIRKLFKGWHFYLLIPYAIFLNNSQTSQQAGYVLWLKSLKRYSTGKLNNLTALSPGLGIVYMVIISSFSDYTRLRALPILFYEFLNLSGLIILSVWNVSESAKWYGFLIQHTATAVTPTIYGWANDILRGDDDFRAAVLCLMNLISQSTLVWIPLLVWKTSEAPEFPKGFPFTAASCGMMIILTVAILYFYTKDQRKFYLKFLSGSTDILPEGSEGLEGSEGSEGSVVDVIKVDHGKV